jgi:putative holliday junction resolvase
MNAAGRVLGIDLGSRRIGVAVTDSRQTVATGVTVLSRREDRGADHQALADLATEYEAVGVVVGLPVSLSGQLGPAARAVLDEVEEMTTQIDLEVDTVDERFTTVAATRALDASGRSRRRQRRVIDRTAATVLLQAWVDQRAARAGSSS